MTEATESALARLRRRASSVLPHLAAPSATDEVTRVLLGRLLADRQPDGAISRLEDVEFKVFSQFGDDGIIQYLVRHLEIPRDRQSFVEFGVESYVESNTRFLVLKDNWRGLVLDGSESNVAAIRAQDLYWRHDVTAVAAFIDRDNISELIGDHGYSGEVGLLSIDIDGNDWWVWERLDVVDPIVVIAEFNAVFGPHRSVAVPYDPAFQRSQAHFSHLYWGASVGALAHLAERKGYRFIGCNGAGNNAYFVRADRADGLPAPSVADGYVDSRFRESRDEQGNLSFLRGDQRLEVMQGLPLVDVESGETIRVGDLVRARGGG